MVGPVLFSPWTPVWFASYVTLGPLVTGGRWSRVFIVAVGNPFTRLTVGSPGRSRRLWRATRRCSAPQPVLCTLNIWNSRPSRAQASRGARTSLGLGLASSHSASERSLGRATVWYHTPMFLPYFPAFGPFLAKRSTCCDCVVKLMDHPEPWWTRCRRRPAMVDRW